jgi:3-phenylpropionate/trans-cinnamate dioxygenase ferredoxin reductase subunit
VSDQHSPSRVVVIGAGLGGLRTVERLRHRGYTGEIVLLGAERHLPYDRPPLSKQVLRGERDDTWLRADGDFAGLDVSLRVGTAAVGLSVPGSAVLTSDGEVAYGVAVIATGAVPRRIPGLGGRVLRTLDDARALRAALKPGCRLVVVGAGLIGCEVAASARAMGVEVALVDVLDAPAVRVLGPTVGARLAELHAEHGVELHLGVGVAGAGAGRVSLASGMELESDVLLEAIGAVPETGWLAGSGLVLADGVVCDGDGRTAGAASVYAVGDVARWAGQRQEHWTSVGQQADHVAAVILGQELPPPDVPYWWSDQYDVMLQGLGHPSPDDDVALLAWGPKARPVAVYSSQGRLTGLVGFSAARAIMRLRPEVAAGVDAAEVLARLTS